MWLKIIPNDTLFFRSGRPFSMGDDTWTDVVFPPYPSTIYGAIRTFLIFEKGTLKDFKVGKLKEIIGTCKEDEKGTLKIIGPFVYNETSNKVYFKTPFDLVRLKNNQEVKLLNLTDKPKVFYTDESVPENFLVFKGITHVDEPKGWLDSNTLKDYLEGEVNGLAIIEDEKIFKYELKIGIARDRKTFTSREGYIYRIPMIRVKKDLGLLIKLEGIEKIDIPRKGIFQLGGDGKTVYYEKIAFNPLEELENIKIELKNNIFKLYFATPAIFGNGWIPKWIDGNSMEGEKEGIKLKLIACAIGKHIKIGGWDIANKRPKTMYKAIPPGSVYYFKILNGANFEKVKKVFHFKNISDENVEEGFGLSLIGRVVEKEIKK